MNGGGAVDNADDVNADDDDDDNDGNDDDDDDRDDSYEDNDESGANPKAIRARSEVNPGSI